MDSEQILIRIELEINRKGGGGPQSHSREYSEQFLVRIEVKN